jgi:hypothetical protein
MTKSVEVDVALKAAEMHGSLDVHLIERVSVTVADRDNVARRLDAAAGCEFLDDRIRFEGDPLLSR